MELLYLKKARYIFMNFLFWKNWTFQAMSWVNILSINKRYWLKNDSCCRNYRILELKFNMQLNRFISAGIFADIFIDSPFNSIRFELLKSLSMIASARVCSAISTWTLVSRNNLSFMKMGSRYLPTNRWKNEGKILFDCRWIAMHGLYYQLWQVWVFFQR